MLSPFTPSVLSVKSHVLSVKHSGTTLLACKTSIVMDQTTTFCWLNHVQPPCLLVKTQLLLVKPCSTTILLVKTNNFLGWTMLNPSFLVPPLLSRCSSRGWCAQQRHLWAPGARRSTGLQEEANVQSVAARGVWILGPCGERWFWWLFRREKGVARKRFCRNVDLWGMRFRKRIPWGKDIMVDIGWYYPLYVLVIFRT